MVEAQHRSDDRIIPVLFVQNPELNRTLDVFRSAGSWFHDHPVTSHEVEEAVLGLLVG